MSKPKTHYATGPEGLRWASEPMQPFNIRRQILSLYVQYQGVCHFNVKAGIVVFGHEKDGQTTLVNCYTQRIIYPDGKTRTFTYPACYGKLNNSQIVAVWLKEAADFYESQQADRSQTGLESFGESKGTEAKRIRDSARQLNGQ